MPEPRSEWSISRAAACGCSRQGAVHVYKRTPCQDAWRIERIREGAHEALVVTVADGHGAPMHDLSGTGSELAVQAAVAEARGLVLGTPGDQTLRQLRLDFRTEFPHRVVARWRELVRADAAHRIPGVDLSAPDLSRVYHRYGSTLLTVIVLEKDLLVSSIGDGNALLIRPDGTIGLHVEQDAPELVGPMTFSLASNDPELLFQTILVPRKDGGMLLLSTDGVVNSFIEPTYYLAFGSGLQERVRDVGFDEVANSVPGWLDYLSAHGSGDDVTMVLAWIEDALPVPRRNAGPGRLVRPLARSRRYARPAAAGVRRVPLSGLDYRGFARPAGGGSR